MKTGNRLTLSTSPLSQPAKKSCGTASLTRRQRPLYRRKRQHSTGKERDSETGLYYYGARYLDSRTGRWLSGDPAMGEYVPSAPVNDEARRRNGSLPGMGGVFNYVNLHVYHYAGNNPVKYIDPDGNQNTLFFSPKEYLRVLIQSNPGMKLLNTIVSAISGDKSSQAQVGDISKEAVKQIASDTIDAAKNTAVITLDATTQTAGFVSDVSGKATVGAVAIGQGEAAVITGGISTISGGIEGLSAFGKAVLTGEKSDMNKANKIISRFTTAFVLGNIGSIFKGSDPLKNTALTNQIIDFTSALLPELKKAIDGNSGE